MTRRTRYHSLPAPAFLLPAPDPPEPYCELLRDYMHDSAFMSKQEPSNHEPDHTARSNLGTTATGGSRESGGAEGELDPLVKHSGEAA